MSLPMDFSTALWWRSVPLWEWEALPPPPEAEAAPPAGTASTAGTAPDAEACAPAPAPAAIPQSAPASTPAPAPMPGSEREGYRLVFKGYQVSASLFWLPSDSPLSRPWLRHDEPAVDRRPRDDAHDAADAAARAALLLQQRAADDSGAKPT